MKTGYTGIVLLIVLVSAFWRLFSSNSDTGRRLRLSLVASNTSGTLSKMSTKYQKYFENKALTKLINQNIWCQELYISRGQMKIFGSCRCS